MASPLSTWRIGAAIAVGGAVGAVLRWWASDTWPAVPAGFPASTFAINVSGCLAIGVLMVAVERGVSAGGYLRPLVGVGMLGGFTTCSTFAVETRALLASNPAIGLAYVITTPAAAIVAACAGAAISTAVLRVRKARRERGGAV